LDARDTLANLGSEEFRQFYLFLFPFNVKEKVKEMDFDIAKFFWEELFKKYKIIFTFTAFIEKQKEGCKIKQDVWNNMLDFVINIGDQFPKGFSTLDSWPTLLDEFFKWYCEKNGIKIEEPEFNP
jgi:hypothetical protein